MDMGKKKLKSTVVQKPTIKELESILDSEEDRAIRILPNGQVVAEDSPVPKGFKPITFREDLGGEYAACVI
jgi:hypothetical protein